MHLLETRYQRAWADAEFPHGIVKYLDKIGLLSPRLTLAHCTWARPDELELIAERGATISVNTSSNLGIRSGVAPMAEMVRRGCRVALGLDGLAFDEDDDGLREMRLAHLLHGGTGFRVDVSRADILAMAFKNGRRSVLNTEEGGAIAAGQPADLLLLDWNAVDDDRLRDDLDPLDLLFARTTARHVHELIVAGRSVVRDGRVLGVDYPAMRDDLYGAAAVGDGANTARLRRARRSWNARSRSISNPSRLAAEDDAMPIAKVHRISAAAPDDVSGIEAAIAAGRIDPKGVIAVLGKTEGNGLVNDFARGYASSCLSLLFQRHLPKEQADKICLVMSGGTEGGMAPHWTVFERAEGNGAAGPALAIGRAHTAALPAEHLGRLAQVDAVAAGVRTAMADAGIDDAGDVHFVQVKCPLLTVARTAEAEARGASVATRDTLKSMGLSRAASALGVAVALGEIDARA